MNTMLYVSPTGSDANNGSEEQPLQTLHAAQDKVRELLQGLNEGETGDLVIHLTQGTHRLNRTLILTHEDAGGDGVSVTWKGAGREKTVISSGRHLTGWERCPEDLPDLPPDARGKVWSIDLPPGTKVTTVYDADGEVPRARGPAVKPLPFDPDNATGQNYGPDGTAGFNTWSHHCFRFAEGALPPASDLDEAECLIIPRMQWTMNILPVEKVDFDQHIVHLAKPCTYPIGVPSCAKDGSIWLENSLSVISPGTWVYHAKNARLYYASEGDTPPPGLEAACLTEFIRVEGCHDLKAKGPDPVKNLHFSGITFTRSNRHPFYGLTGRGIQHDWEMHDAPSCMVRFRHAQDCSVTDCDFTQGGSGGLRMDLACRDNTVQNCEFSHLGGCGVVLCGYGLSRLYCNRNNTVVHNHIHHIGEHYWHSPGIFIWQSGNNHIADNHLHDTPYTAIVCSGRTLYDREGMAECSRTIHWEDVEEQCGKGYVHNVWHYGGLPSWWMREPLMHSRDNLIEYNHIHDVMQTMGDGNGVYVSGAGGGNVVRFNVVGPCPSRHMAEGIRCDDDQHHTILHGNLIFGLHGHATGITLKGVNRVTNNIIALPLKATQRGMLSLETGPLNGSVIQRNIILTSATDQTFVSEMRMHGEGRKARLCDTDSDYNLYFCTASEEAGREQLGNLQAYGVDVHSLSEDPGFVDPANGNFNLKPDAAAHLIGFQPLPLERMFGKKA